MSCYKEVFKNKNSLIVVIHAESQKQTLRNVKIARESEVDGVFLINHRMSAVKLLSIYQIIRQSYPNWWIGLNCLDLYSKNAIRQVPSGASGLWVDNAGINCFLDSASNAKENLKELEKRQDWNGLYFGGVAFKYQKPVLDLARVSKLATEFVDVITTSGDGTGMPAEPKKLKIIRDAVGNFPIAVASGITADNISQYVDLVDCFLVASGISRSFTELDEKKVKYLVKSMKV